MRTALAFAILTLLASCSAAPHAPLERLAALREVHVDYHAELGPSTARDAAHAGEGATPAASVVPPAPGSADAEPSIEVTCEFLHFTAAAEAELFGPGRVEGRVFARNDLASVRERCQRAGLVLGLSAPRLRVNDGQRGFVSVLNETAFVRAFTLSPAAGSLILDPEVATVEEGYRLEWLPRLSKGSGTLDAPGAAESIELELVIHATQLVHPVGEMSASIPGFPNAVTLELPIGFDQHFGAKLVLARGEVLVVRGLLDRDGRTLVAVIGGERKEPEAAELRGPEGTRVARN